MSLSGDYLVGLSGGSSPFKRISRIVRYEIREDLFSIYTLARGSALRGRQEMGRGRTPVIALQLSPSHRLGPTDYEIRGVGPVPPDY